MFKIFKMKPHTPADVKLEQIIQLLYPPLELNYAKDGTKFHVDRSVDTNLEAVLMDLEDGHNDKASQTTIRKVTDQLIKVRKLLEAYQEFDAEAKYFIADDPETSDVQEIQAASREH